MSSAAGRAACRVNSKRVLEKLSGKRSVNSPSLRLGLAFSDKHAHLGLRCILNLHVACAIALVRIRVLRTNDTARIRARPLM